MDHGSFKLCPTDFADKIMIEQNSANLVFPSCMKSPNEVVCGGGGVAIKAFRSTERSKCEKQPLGYDYDAMQCIIISCLRQYLV